MRPEAAVYKEFTCDDADLVRSFVGDDNIDRLAPLVPNRIPVPGPAYFPHHRSFVTPRSLYFALQHCDGALSLYDAVGWVMTRLQNPDTPTESWLHAGLADTGWLWWSAGYTPGEAAAVTRHGSAPSNNELRTLAAWRGVTVPNIRGAA